jgi:hypothetical protein
MRRALLLAFIVVSAASCLTGPMLPDGGEPPVGGGAGGGEALGGGTGDDGGAATGGGGGGDVDGGLEDAGPVEVDAGTDAGTIDADAGADGGAEADAGLDAGFRPALDGGHPQVLGSCFRVPGELFSPQPSYIEVRLDFGMDQFDDPAERPRLTPGAQTILATPNAGGSSVVSEAFAMEVLALCEGASLVKTETEITYDPPTSKKTDILVNVDGSQLGVSVTRAVSFPRDGGYPVSQAFSLLDGKLSDILVSSQNVVAPDNWVKQALVVMAWGDLQRDSIRTAWGQLDAGVRADTILYVVVTDGLDAPIY